MHLLLCAASAAAATEVATSHDLALLPLEVAPCMPFSMRLLALAARVHALRLSGARQSIAAVLPSWLIAVWLAVNGLVCTQKGCALDPHIP